MKWTEPIPIRGTSTGQRRIVWLIVGVVLAHAFLMMSNPHALAADDAADPHSHRHVAMGASAMTEGVEGPRIANDHHCSPLSGNLKQMESDSSHAQVIVSLARQERASRSAIPSLIDPHPPDRSIFQVYRI